MEAKGRDDLAATGASKSGRKHGHARGEERDDHRGDEADGVHGPHPHERGERDLTTREVKNKCRSKKKIEEQKNCGRV